MLAMSDAHGRVWGSVPGLANRARVPVEDVRTALTTFLAPDADSRTPAFEGRRIEVIDGGWRLLNHEKYRQIRDDESIKETKRKYINARREKERAEALQSLNVDQPVDKSRAGSNAVDRSRANAEAEADSEALKEKERALSALVVKADAAKAGNQIPSCHHEAIIQAYHDALPELPRAVLLSTKRKRSLSKFWGWVLTSRKTDGAKRAGNAAEALDWIKAYFVRASQNDFLMGRTQRSEAHSGWQCDLDYLLTDRGMQQVIEKTQEAA